ncbi:MAG: DUF2779 domain-containing protein [Erysipelotrichaceae bacterium]|nr:DUF2779 domain-containing protein [Erysipelotrichaceae bacterium]
MMHLSDIRHYERCARLAWLCAHEPQPFVPFVYMQESMSELAKQYFHLEDYFEGNVGDDPALAMAALKTKDVLLNARFTIHDLRIKISMMKRSEEGWDIYFFYSSCYPKESEAQKLADTLQVLKALNVLVKKVWIVHLNAAYVRSDELDVQQLLLVTPYLYNRKNKAYHLAMDLINECQRDVFAFGDAIASLLEAPCPVCKEHAACMRGGKCRYYAHCFPAHHEDTSVLNFIQTAHKYELMDQGVVDMRDIDVQLLEGTRQQYAQIMAARNGGFYVDRFALRNWLKQTFSDPISYLDFEWESYAIPPYKGMRPFDVLVFQYSLHIEEKGKELRHEEYIGEGDCRIDFIEHLLAAIPKTGTILVYNMEGAEKLRLIQLQAQFPQYKEQLNDLCERMVDLALPFVSGCIYDSRMRGYHSLKVLSKVFNDMDYQDLEISQGLQAPQNWRRMQSDPDAKESIRKALLAYCAMDTYAEYALFHKLMELAATKDEEGNGSQLQI